MSSYKQPYGAAVVGEAEAAARAQVAQPRSVYGTDVLGPSVVGDKKAAANLEHARERIAENERRPGPVPAGARIDEAAFSEIVEKHKGSDGYLSIKDTQAVLTEMPEAFDRLLGWEFNREGGPRVGALNHFLQVEISRDGGARPSVHQAIEKALAKARAK